MLQDRELASMQRRDMKSGSGFEKRVVEEVVSSKAQCNGACSTAVVKGDAEQGGAQ
ncbi:hypothetical protein F442_22944 [Phytophthora nicotianae P10297]|uniref:Uncharacterized protein n=2 Tax=Phytophthora nicotianae TaxID=4792 RepID=W2XY59_PHYNI|nr:hypothetical protein F444_04237 [Phytophthora nicotianae P1976]ETP27775.1 hypothetical protein F442_22944 [Phytophthora nicotianae P10297]